MTSAVLALAVLAPWVFAGFCVYHSRGLLAAFTDFWQANHTVGGEPAQMADRRLTLAEKDAEHARNLAALRAEQDRRNAAAAFYAGYGLEPDGGMNPAGDPMPVSPRQDENDGRS